ncbi:hypothetical protein FF1_030327 [Malus domestica]
MIISFLDIGPIFSSLSLASFGASGLLFTSGGYIMYNSRGTTINDTKPGTIAALAQSVHPIVCLIVFNAKLALKGLAAMAVKNIADEITEVWKHVSINHDPNLPSVPSPTLLPQATQRDFTNGKKIPPARAETEGIAGASKASLKTRLYPNPREELPKRETNWYAIRFPSPVLMKPRAKKKARAMSQGIGSPKAEKAAPKVSVFVRTEAPRPSKATAPRGRG